MKVEVHRGTPRTSSGWREFVWYALLLVHPTWANPPGATRLSTAGGTRILQITSSESRQLSSRWHRSDDADIEEVVKAQNNQNVRTTSTGTAPRAEKQESAKQGASSFAEQISSLPGSGPAPSGEDAGQLVTQPRIAEVYTFGAPKITQDKNWLSDAIPENASLPGLRVWTEQCGEIAPGFWEPPRTRSPPGSAGNCLEPHDTDFGAQSSFLLGDWYHPTMDALQLVLANPKHGGITGGDWGAVYEKIVEQQLPLADLVPATNYLSTGDAPDALAVLPAAEQSLRELFSPMTDPYLHMEPAYFTGLLRAVAVAKGYNATAKDLEQAHRVERSQAYTHLVFPQKGRDPALMYPTTGGGEDRGPDGLMKTILDPGHTYFRIRPIARVSLLTRHFGTDVLLDEDIVSLSQDTATRRCVLALSPTNSVDELVSSNLLESTPKNQWCGALKQVHSGYANKADQALRCGLPPMANALATCSELDLAGHSLGGSAATLLFACAQHYLQMYNAAPNPGDLKSVDGNLAKLDELLRFRPAELSSAPGSARQSGSLFPALKQGDRGHVVHLKNTLSREERMTNCDAQLHIAELRKQPASHRLNIDIVPQ
ncbi:unnamed protein product [Amoebophrya sp. A120]|nr:unnamed protein product [Amoebophrya sp. A120]|eukprot:GSA120T00021323001.1